MSFGGFTALSAAILRNNRLLLQRRRSFKDLREMYIEEAHQQATKDQKTLQLPLADKSVIQALRKKLLKERRRAVYRQFFYLAITLAIGVTVVYLILRYLF